MLFCVDASGSMAARKRMDAGQDRDPLAAARRLPPPRQGRPDHLPRRPAPSSCCRRRTRSRSPPRRLDELPAGGRTPLAEGLLEAAKVLRRERLRDPRLRPLLVVVTDGRATHGADAVARSRAPRSTSPGSASPRSSSTARAARSGSGSPPGSPRCLRRRAPAVAEVSAAALTGTVRPTPREGWPDAPGPADRRTRRRPHHPPAPQPPARDGAHRRRQGEVDGRLRDRPARLEPGLADRGLPVREVRQVAHRRADRARAARSAARGDRRGRSGRVAQDGLGLVVDPQGTATTTTTPPPRSRAGRRSSAGSPPRRHDL